MAHAARISALADSLVQRVLGVEAGDREITQTRPAVARGLRDNSHARTNQFDVKARLDGLVEKFTVLDRDDLSEALQARLQELPSTGKWLPEILALLLALSDRPVENTSPDALGLLRSDEAPDEQLTWEAIIADDPLDEPGVWDDIERGYHSSGDETGLDDDLGSERTSSSQATTVDEHGTDVVARSYVIAPDASALGPIKRFQPSHETSAPEGVTHLSDLLVIRQSLSMLRGLPTAIYDNERTTGRILPNSSAKSATASSHTIHDALVQFAILGNALQLLQTWVSQEGTRTYTRTCKASIERLLASMCRKMSTLEEQYVGQVQQRAVSLISVLADVECLARPLCEIASVIRALPTALPFAILDALYNKACVAQLSGDYQNFEVFSSVLFEATETYLRPVATWISTGIISFEDDDLFIAHSENTCQLQDLWHASHTLRFSDDGKPSAPTFMHAKAADIFALGKAKMFLDKLEPSASAAESAEIARGGPDFASLRIQLESNPLTPFPELFDDALRSWIQTISTDVTPKLHRCLIEQHGLLDLLTTFECSFLGASGDLFLDFATVLFSRMTRMPLGWANDFLLTELARETLGASALVDPVALSITVESESNLVKPSSVVEMLQCIRTSYRVPLALQNITREATPTTHNNVFTLNLQLTYVERALAALQINSISEHSPLLLRLRQALFVFAQTMRSHVTISVLAHTPILRASIKNAQTVDEMVAAYAAHKAQLSTALLLSSNLQPIRDSVASVLVHCEKFARLWHQIAVTPQLVSTIEDSRASSQTDAIIALRKLQKDFSSALSFVAAGVRSVSRASGSNSLESLAQQLEWVVGTV